jgi:hypothetical protein
MAAVLCRLDNHCGMVLPTRVLFCPVADATQARANEVGSYKAHCEFAIRGETRRKGPALALVTFVSASRYGTY